MSDTKYTYAVARIRALEVSLFSSSTIEQLIACKDHESCLRFLTEHGWGGVDVPLNADAILTREQEKIWETIREMQVDMDVFDVLSYPNWFHNLKAAVKEVCTGKSGANIYFEGTPISKEEMARIIREKDYQALPENMREAASEAVDTLLHSGEGQLCDVIIDRATMEAILAAGKKSKAAIIRDYAESTVAVANIKVAVRCCKTGKSLEFMKRAMAPCKTLNVERLAHAALVGLDAVMEYLNGAGYAEAAEALKESPSAFERWCDNRIIETIQPQKTNPFSVGPLVAYVIARQNEIKTVRIILTCKQNGLSDDSIRERVREMYKIAVMGAYDSIYGFASLGLDIHPVSDIREGEETLRRLATGEYAVIYITEELAAQIPHEIARYREQVLPAIIQIPGVAGNTGAGIEGVKKSVEQAVGSDILFGND